MAISLSVITSNINTAHYLLKDKLVEWIITKIQHQAAPRIVFHQ